MLTEIKKINYLNLLHVEFANEVKFNSLIPKAIEL